MRAYSIVVGDGWMDPKRRGYTSRYVNFYTFPKKYLNKYLR